MYRGQPYYPPASMTGGPDDPPPRGCVVAVVLSLLAWALILWLVFG